MFSKFTNVFKKVTIGMPPFNEHTISTPLPEGELRQVIHDAYGDDESTAMLTQVYFKIKKRIQHF